MTGRTIPIALEGRLQQPVTRDCRLWKLMPRDGVAAPPFGLTSLNRDVVYDDESVDGEITFKAFRGYTPYNIESTADLSVDNSEMEVLVAEFEVDGFTSDAIRRGVYDGARFIEYLIDYEHPEDGHTILQSGTVGRIVQVDNLVCFPESRSLTQTLKQKSIIELGSNNCRVVQFGDERCGVDVDALLVSGEVTAVGVETDRVLTVDGPTLADNAMYPGIVKFLTGANAGRTYEVEGNVGNVITLAIPTEEPMAVGDEFERRPDCTRLWDGPNGCGPEGHDNRPNFRGEPKRPVSETANLMSPGAGSSSGGGTIDETAPL
jgi:uncharacterized phage protein (TIGR02218 family)